jgi:hypothetical protein
MLLLISFMPKQQQQQQRGGTTALAVEGPHFNATTERATVRDVSAAALASEAGLSRTMLVSEQLTRASPVGRLLSLRVLPPCWCLSRSTRTPARPTTRVTLLMRRRCPDASLFWRRDLCRMLPLAVEMVRPFRTKSVPPATPTRQRPYHSSNFGPPEKEQRGGGGGEKRR